VTTEYQGIWKIAIAQCSYGFGTIGSASTPDILAIYRLPGCLYIADVGLSEQPGTAEKEVTMTVYTPEETNKRAEQYRVEGGRLTRTANAFVFRAMSTSTPDDWYTVQVEPGTALDAAQCSCPAGQRGNQCKHGAAAISAVWLRTVSDAARILARHGARKRAIARVA
jgi:hypothetical protein